MTIIQYQNTVELLWQCDYHLLGEREREREREVTKYGLLSKINKKNSVGMKYTSYFGFL